MGACGVTIFYLSPGEPGCISGGTRKLYDHVAILQAHGFDATLVHTHEVGKFIYRPEDIMVIPEVYGDGIRDFVPSSVRRRIVFVQNGYLIDAADGTQYVADQQRHPYMTTPELVAIFTESEHTTDIVQSRFPDLPVPIIRTHSSGNGRRGEDAGFHFGPWPREKVVCYFDYKHAADNEAMLHRLHLPTAWQVECLTGRTDEQIAETMRRASIFVATNKNEGMCAPTSEALISGCVVVCWTGGGPDEYLIGRAQIAPQDDVGRLRDAIERTAESIDLIPEWWGAAAREWSDWFQRTYSREREITELVAIFSELTAKVDA
jgi:hypothetical protein